MHLDTGSLRLQTDEESMILDTNILIYAAKPGGENLRRWVEDPLAAISIISRIEALGWAGITDDETAALKTIFSSLPEIGLTDAVADRAIELRRERKMTIADAVIVASALTRGASLVTWNVDDFRHVPGLSVITPFASKS